MYKIGVIYDNIKYKAQIEYSFNILFQRQDCTADIYSIEEYKQNKQSYDYIIGYSKNIYFVEADLIIVEANLFSDNYLKKASVPKEVNYHRELPVFFYNEAMPYFINENSNVLNIDVIQTIFFFLTCYEDYIIDDYDSYGRINIKESLLYKNDLLCRPVVNETIDYFISIINSHEGNVIERKNLWNNKEVAVLLSHDVDAINKYLPFIKEIRMQLSILLKDKKFKVFLNRIFGYVSTKLLHNKKDPYDTFDYILKLEKNYEFKSSFYFMSDNKFYDINGSKVKKIAKNIVKNGSEVGFHPGHKTSCDSHEFSKQANRLTRELNLKEALGVRQHYLAFKSGTTWELQEKNSIYYDSTIGYPQQVGFKSGYCLPYKPYSLTNDKILDLWEIPMTIMEGSLIQYMALDFDASLKCFDKLYDKIKKHNGVFVLLWHNSSITEEYSEFSKKLMGALYRRFHEENCYVSSGKEITKIYEKAIGETYDIKK